MGYNSRSWVLICKPKTGVKDYSGQKFTKTEAEDWNNVIWSDDSQCLLRHVNSRVRIWYQQLESMAQTCIVSTVQVDDGDGEIVLEIFLAHFGLLKTSQASFECHGLSEHQSLYELTKLIMATSRKISMSQSTHHHNLVPCT